MACAEKEDSPQFGRDHKGMASMASHAEPWPKLRVTCFSCNEALDFAGFGVALTFNDLLREDNVFEITNCEVVIVKLLSRVG